MSFELGTISSEVKMTISSNFTEIWKKHFTLISTSVYSLILVVLEKILESEFKCPEDLHLRRSYSIFYFIMPAATFFILGIIFQRAYLHPFHRENEFYYFYNKCKSDNKCKSHFTDKCTFRSCWCVLLKAVFPALLWIVILLLDGRYAYCFNENIRNYQNSQISGLIIMFAVVSIGLTCTCCCKKGYRKKITVDEDKIKNLLAQKAHEYILKQKEEAIWQRLKDEYLADPETILVSIDKEKISDIIDSVCSNSREGSADQGGPQETASLLLQATSNPLYQAISNPLYQGTSSP
nr:uncharacterized protein LOC101953705 [Chrysemys picta bellii]